MRFACVCAYHKEDEDEYADYVPYIGSLFST
jgi:hypothetical protein